VPRAWCYGLGVRPRFLLALPLVAALVVACGAGARPAASPSPDCREDAVDDAEVGAKTGVAGAKTGVLTAVEGVKTFGSATAGLVEGGKDEAKERWKKGAAETKATAKKGSAQTKQQGDVPKCH
jgi:hypothetical protein